MDFATVPFHSELTDAERARFFQDFEAGRIGTPTTLLITLFFGIMGGHMLYLGNRVAFVRRLVFYWTLIPLFLVLSEFLTGKIPTWVDEYNEDLAKRIVATIKGLPQDEQRTIPTPIPSSLSYFYGDSAKDEAVVETGPTGLLLEEGSGTAESAPPPPPAPVAASEARGDAAESSVSSQAAEKLRQKTIQAEEIRAVARDTLVAESTRGKIEIVGEKIRITHKGFVAFTEGTTGTKEILISQISSIQFRPAGKLLLGYIQFTFPGSQDTKGLTASAGDENALTFTDEEQPAFEVLKEKIDEMRNDFAQAPTGAAPVSQMDELEKLAALRDRGIVSEEEFQAKKKQILGI